MSSSGAWELSSKTRSGSVPTAMVPLVLYGELVAVFELGRRDRPFKARELGRVEDVLEVLAGRAVVMGWA